MLAEWTVALGETAELLADRGAITRETQDAFALRSHQRAAAVVDAGVFTDEIIAVPDVDLMHDECIRPATSLEGLAALRPVFRPDNGTVTAGNSSPLNDGAACLLLADESGVARVGREPLARIVARAISAVTPQHFGIGWSDLRTVELNEAFAAQCLACLAEWSELDPEIVNPLGGARHRPRSGSVRHSPSRHAGVAATPGPCASASARASTSSSKPEGALRRVTPPKLAIAPPRPRAVAGRSPVGVAEVLALEGGVVEGQRVVHHAEIHPEDEVP